MGIEGILCLIPYSIPPTREDTPTPPYSLYPSIPTMEELQPNSMGVSLGVRAQGGTRGIGDGRVGVPRGRILYPDPVYSPLGRVHPYRGNTSMYNPDTYAGIPLYPSIPILPVSPSTYPWMNVSILTPIL